MNFDRTLFISILDGYDVRKAHFLDNFNIHEFNFIAWNSTGLSNEMMRFMLIPGRENDVRAAETFKRAFVSKANEILEWVNDGNIFLVIPEIFPKLRLTDGNIMDITSLPIFNLISLRPASGQLVEPVNKFSEILSEIAEGLTYKYVHEGRQTIPIFRSSSSKTGRSQIVGSIQRIGRGLVVFSPTPSNLNDPEDIEEYLEAIVRLPSLLGSGSGTLPEWANAFLSTYEHSAKAVMSELHQEIAELNRRVNEQSEIITAEREWKVLYTGTDQAFVDIVARALRDLGLHVGSGPHPRADLIVWDGSHRLAAAEVKGLEGAAREFNVGQTVRWVSDVNAAIMAGPTDSSLDPDIARYQKVLEELGIARGGGDQLECRGLLILGTHRLVPLSDRPTEQFPDPIARALTRVRVCALTGLDLYCIVQAIRTDPSRKMEIIDTLFETDGGLVGWDWRNHITSPAGTDSDTPVRPATAALRRRPAQRKGRS